MESRKATRVINMTTSRKTLRTIGLCALVLEILAAFCFAATPASGTLTDSNSITYTAGPFLVPNPTGFVNGTVDGTPPTCDSTHPCDDFALTVNISSTSTTTKLMKVKVKW